MPHCPGATYLWQDGSTAATFAANSPGTYTVDVTVANCTTSDVIVVRPLHPSRG